MEESSDVKNTALSLAAEHEDDPVVLAYRLGGKGRSIERVRRSEILADKNLVEVGRSAQSFGFDPVVSLNRESERVLPANAHIQKKIQFKLMAEEIRERVSSRDRTLSSLPDLPEIKSINDPAAQYILTLVTDQLIAEGLWREEDKDLTMTEAFPLSQAMNESKVRQNGVDVLEEGTFLQESDLTPEDVSGEEGGARTRFSRLPTLATPPLHNLMRASPQDLYHQVARRLIDAHYFDDHPEKAPLFRACYFVSKGVEDESHFAALMSAGLEKSFSHYTFDEFRIERVALRRHLRTFIDNYFSQNPAIQARLGTEAKADDSESNIWARFIKVWSSLTSKQQEGLEGVYMSEEGFTQDEIARRIGISINSLVNRLRVAINRFRAEFPELECLSPKRLTQRALQGHVTHNGLWRYESAKRKNRLVSVDPVTGLRKEIEWRKTPKSKNLDWKMVAKVKAEIIENCPVPYFHDTEYFDGMKPTILSMSHTPEEFENEKNLNAGFQSPK